jgi:cholesterol transport system auxiliary component
MNRFVAFLTIISTVVVASGCTGLNTLTTATAPTDLYLLTPKSTFDPNLPKLEEQIVVAEPTATAAVSNDRITVQPTPLEVRFLPGVRWVDRAPLIVQSLLIESYENSGKVEAVGPSAIGLRAEYVIVPDIREFQARLPPDAPPNAPLEAHVGINIKIVNEEFDRIIASRSFERFRTSESDAPEDIVFAFDGALGAVMKDIVEWSVRQMYRDARRREAEEQEQQTDDDEASAGETSAALCEDGTARCDGDGATRGHAPVDNMDAQNAALRRFGQLDHHENAPSSVVTIEN